MGFSHEAFVQCRFIGVPGRGLIIGGTGILPKDKTFSIGGASPE